MAKKAVKRGYGIAAVVILLFLLFVGTLLFGKAMDRRTYRLEHAALITRYAEEYGLDPYLVAAVIHVESSNDPNAVSKSGALGLMQVMPQTGEWIAGKLDLGAFSSEMLFEPQMNIRMGCWYLDFLTKRFDSNRLHIIAAYNAGHGNVESWLEDETLTRDGELHSIPFEETEHYVEKIQRAYEKYKTLYPEWPKA